MGDLQRNNRSHDTGTINVHGYHREPNPPVFGHQSAQPHGRIMIPTGDDRSKTQQPAEAKGQGLSASDRGRSGWMSRKADTWICWMKVVTMAERSSVPVFPSSDADDAWLAMRATRSPFPRA